MVTLILYLHVHVNQIMSVLFGYCSVSLINYIILQQFWGIFYSFHLTHTNNGFYLLKIMLLFFLRTNFNNLLSTKFGVNSYFDHIAAICWNNMKCESLIKSDFHSTIQHLSTCLRFMWSNMSCINLPLTLVLAYYVCSIAWFRTVKD